jgi:hypothetical protein
MGTEAMASGLAVAISSSPEVDGLDGIGSEGSWDPMLISNGEDPIYNEFGGDVLAGENPASTFVLADDGGATWRRYLVEGMVFVCLVITLESGGSYKVPTGGIGAISLA